MTGFSKHWFVPFQDIYRFYRNSLCVNLFLWGYILFAFYSMSLAHLLLKNMLLLLLLLLLLFTFNNTEFIESLVEVQNRKGILRWAVMGQKGTRKEFFKNFSM